ncbi:MAG: putative metal-dependent hydrolase [Flavobacteriales bacterium]|nr:putative metal-dependent hydrolase [Flavobacteriales bacterium]
MNEELRYPIGKFKNNADHTPDNIKNYLQELKQLPDKLNRICSGLSDVQMGKTYREGAWNVKQLIHHIGESHLNAYIRVKLAITEDNPVIKPYLENPWVFTKENEILHPEVSLKLIEGIHLKMVTLFENLEEDDWKKTYMHPQYNRTFSLMDIAALYSWHGNHHLAHIQIALS